MLKYQTLPQMLDDRSRGTAAIGYLEGENAEKSLKVADLRRRHPPERVLPAIYGCAGLVDIVTLRQAVEGS